MKNFLACSAIFVMCVYLVSGAAIEERRLREGNSFSRKLKSCNLLCSLKGGVSSSSSTTKCYRIASQKTVVTECVFRCLRLKGESPEAEECECRNGVCIEGTSTSSTSTTTTTTTTSARPPTEENPEPETEGQNQQQSETPANQQNQGQDQGNPNAGTGGQTQRRPASNNNQSKRKI